MNAYIGTKIVLAEPMDCGTFEGTVGIIPRHAGEGPDGPHDGYKVVYEDGYTSWSPRETFERAYRLVTEAECRLLGAGGAS